MCQPTTCEKCKKPSYVGCGRHVEQVLGHVPPEQRCKCREEAARAADPRKTQTAPKKWFF